VKGFCRVSRLHGPPFTGQEKKLKKRDRNRHSKVGSDMGMRAQLSSHALERGLQKYPYEHDEPKDAKTEHYVRIELIPRHCRQTLCPFQYEDPRCAKPEHQLANSLE
jgi:hypothetical protein